MEHTTMKLTAREVELLTLALHEVMHGVWSDATTDDAGQLHKRLERAQQRLAGRAVPVSAPPAATEMEPAGQSDEQYEFGAEQGWADEAALRASYGGTLPSEQHQQPDVEPQPELSGITLEQAAQLAMLAGHLAGASESAGRTAECYGCASDHYRDAYETLRRVRKEFADFLPSICPELAGERR